MTATAERKQEMARRRERRAATLTGFRPVPRKDEPGRGWFALAERRAGHLATLTRAEREAPLSVLTLAAARQLGRRALLKVRP